MFWFKKGCTYFNWRTSNIFLLGFSLWTSRLLWFVLNLHIWKQKLVCLVSTKVDKSVEFSHKYSLQPIISTPSVLKINGLEKIKGVSFSSFYFFFVERQSLLIKDKKSSRYKIVNEQLFQKQPNLRNSFLLSRSVCAVRDFFRNSLSLIIFATSANVLTDIHIPKVINNCRI